MISDTKVYDTVGEQASVADGVSVRAAVNPAPSVQLKDRSRAFATVVQTGGLVSVIVITWV